jgi:hypothetical protein
MRSTQGNLRASITAWHVGTLWAAGWERRLRTRLQRYLSPSLLLLCLSQDMFVPQALIVFPGEALKAWHHTAGEQQARCTPCWALTEEPDAALSVVLETRRRHRNHTPTVAVYETSSSLGVPVLLLYSRISASTVLCCLRTMLAMCQAYSLLRTNHMVDAYTEYA